MICVSSSTLHPFPSHSLLASGSHSKLFPLWWFGCPRRRPLGNHKDTLVFEAGKPRKISGSNQQQKQKQRTGESESCDRHIIILLSHALSKFRSSRRCVMLIIRTGGVIYGLQIIVCHYGRFKTAVIVLSICYDRRTVHRLYSSFFSLYTVDSCVTTPSDKWTIKHPGFTCFSGFMELRNRNPGNLYICGTNC